MNSNKNIICQVLTEFIEIAIHNLIKIREIYPDTIFEKRQKYGTIVYQAIHPQLKEYISNCMQAVNELTKHNQLSKVVLCFMKSHRDIIEKIVFDISYLKFVFDKDPYLLEIETNFKSFFSRLYTINEYLYSLPDNSTFAIQIHTTESSGNAYMDNPTYQTFPWMRVNSNFSEISESLIVPIETIENSFIDMQIFIERQQ